MIIDFHTHIAPPEFDLRREYLLSIDETFAELYSDPNSKFVTVEELIQSMDLNGIDMSVIMGMGWSDPGIAREFNDYIIESVKKYPARLAGFASTNPVWGSQSSKEIERCFNSGLIGVGEFHPDTQFFDLSDCKTMSPLMEVVNSYDLIFNTHSSEPVGHYYRGKGNTGPKTLWDFITTYPGTRIICSHWGGGLPFYSLMPEVKESFTNVYFDTATSPYLYSNEVFSIVTSLVGSKKILMGSDYPLIAPSRIIRDLQKSTLSSTEIKAITGTNAMSLLKLT